MAWYKNEGGFLPSSKKIMKLLVIGNSFSIDSAHWVFDIAKSAGVNVVVGVAHDSGQSLSGHWEKIQNNETISMYHKWTPGDGHTSQPNLLLKNIVTDE